MNFKFNPWRYKGYTFIGALIGIILFVAFNILRLTHYAGYCSGGYACSKTAFFLDGYYLNTSVLLNRYAWLFLGPLLLGIYIDTVKRK
jgi:hypothetical protein